MVIICPNLANLKGQNMNGIRGGFNTRPNFFRIFFSATVPNTIAHSNCAALCPSFVAFNVVIISFTRENTKNQQTKYTKRKTKTKKLTLIYFKILT